MNEPALDVLPRVEYSLDKWAMDRLPWGVWGCLGGLAVILNADGGGKSDAALAFVYLALLGLAFAGWAATTMIERSALSFWMVLPAVLLITIFVVLLITLVAGKTGGQFSTGRLWWSRLVDPPITVFGWMLLYLGCGWIAYTLLRHVYPPRPVIMLSSRGVAFHRPWLKDLLIPWHEIHRVGHLELPNTAGPPSVYPRAIVVVVTQGFYERNIAPKRSILSPPGSDLMFRPSGEMMQMVLSSPELVVAPENIRRPIEVRWKKYRELPHPTPPPEVRQDPPHIVYGRWAFDGSLWQSIRFLAPLVGLVILAATSIWQH